MLEGIYAMYENRCNESSWRACAELWEATCYRMERKQGLYSLTFAFQRHQVWRYLLTILDSGAIPI